MPIIDCLTSIDKLAGKIPDDIKKYILDKRKKISESSKGISEGEIDNKTIEAIHKELFDDLNKLKVKAGLETKEYVKPDNLKEIAAIHQEHDKKIEEVNKKYELEKQQSLLTNKNTDNDKAKAETNAEAEGQLLAQDKNKGAANDAAPSVEPKSENEGGGKEPPITPEQKAANNSDNLSQWTRVNLQSLSKMKELFRKVGIGWDKRSNTAMEELQAKSRPDEPLTQTATRELDAFHANLTEGKPIRSNTNDQIVMHFLKISTEQQLAKIHEDAISNNSFSDFNSLGTEVLGEQLNRINSVLGAMRSESGVSLGYGTVEAILHPEYGLKVRQMEMIKRNGGEPLTTEQETFLKEQWAKEQEINKRELEIQKQSLQESFDNRIADMQRQLDAKLKQTKGSSKSIASSDRLRNFANKIRNSKTLDSLGLGESVAPDAHTSGVTFNVKEALANVIDHMADGLDKAAAIAKALKNYGIEKSEELSELVDKALIQITKPDREEVTIKIKDLIKDTGDTRITKDMVSQNIIRDYVESYLGEGSKKDILNDATKELQKILPDVDVKTLAEAYLKKGEFKPETKKTLENLIQKERTELNRLAKKELSSTTQQKIKLQQEKENAIKKIKEFDKRLKNKDFDEPSKEPMVHLNKSDGELIKLNVERKAVESAYREEQNQYRKNKTHFIEKAVNTARAAWVMYLIGSPKTLAKIAWMSLIKPSSEVLSKLTFGKAFGIFNPEIAKAAKKGGESNSIATIKKMAQAYFLQKGEKGLEKLYDNSDKKYKEAIQKYEDYKESNNPSNNKLEKLNRDINNEMANTVGNFMYKFIGGSSLKDALDALVNRSNKIEKMFGDVGTEKFNKDEYMSIGGKSFLGLSNDNLNYVMGFVGRSHSAVKTFSGRSSFAAGFMARVEAALEAKEDINGTKLLEIGHESYLDWERGKYQQSNWTSDKWNTIVNNIETNRNKNKLWNTLDKGLAQGLKTDIAITRVPVNIIHEEIAHYLTGAFRAPILAAREYNKANKQAISEGFTKGIKIEDEHETGITSEAFKVRVKEIVSQMDGDQAALIMRLFRKGGLGLGLYATAAIYGALHFGIFQHRGQKKKKEESELKPDELNPGQIMFGKTKLGETMSAMIEHTPALWPTFMGFGMAQQYHDDIAKNKTSSKAAINDIIVHLKIIEGNIPQTKIFSPAQLIEDKMKSLSKSAQTWGLTDPSFGKGNQFKDNETRKFISDNSIKIPDATSTYIDKTHQKVQMPNDKYTLFTERRSERIENGLRQLMKTVKEKNITDKESIRETVKDIVKRETEMAKKEIFKEKYKKESNPTIPLPNYKPLPFNTKF